MHRSHPFFIRAAVIGVCVALASPAAADSPYERDRSQEVLWLTSGGVLAVGGFILTQKLTPLTGAELAALNPDNINSFDRDHMHPYHPDHAGDAMVITSFALPFALLGRDDVREDKNTFLLMWAETNLLSQGLAAIVKPIAKRARPYAYDPNAPEDIRTSRNALVSFYSAHTVGAAANCFFLATVFSDYSDNRNAEIAIWTGAAIYPVVTAYFRVDSGHHFVTDTIVGYTVGAALGYLVPALHRRKDSPAPPGATPNRSSGIGAAIGVAAGCLTPVVRRLSNSPVSVQPASVDGAPGFVASLSF